MQREQAQTLIVQLNPLTFVNAKRILKFRYSQGRNELFSTLSSRP